MSSKQKSPKENSKKSDSSSSNQNYLTVNVNLSDITCVCCQEIMIEPILYPCAHRICKDCTKNLLFGSAHPKVCPLCRTPISYQILNNVDTFMVEITKQAPIQFPCGQVMNMNEYVKHEEKCLKCCNQTLQKIRKEQEYDRTRQKSNRNSSHESSDSSPIMRLFFPEFSYTSNF